MTKYLSKEWLRILSCILCTIAFIGLGAAAVCSIAYARMGTYTQCLEEGAQKIADNYALYAYDLLIEQKEEEKLSEFLKENGLYCTVQKVEADASTEEAEQIYHYAAENTKWEYSTKVIGGSYYQYSISSLQQALLYCEWFESEGYWVEFPITGFVYDAASGIFYYETEVAYFPISYIYIYFKDDSYIDYKLKEIDGELCYYNSYYHLRLNPQEADSWKSIDTENSSLSLWKSEESTDWDSVRYVADSSLLNKRIYTSDYSVEGFDNVIICSNIWDLDSYQIQISRSNMGNKNLFEEWENLLSVFYMFYDSIVPLMAVSAVLFCIALALLVSSSFSQEQHLGRLHKIPLGIYSILLMTVQGLCFLLMDEGIVELILKEYIQPEAGYTMLAILTIAIVYLAFVYLQNLIDRFRSGCLWRYSELYYAGKIVSCLWKKSTAPIRFLKEIFREDVNLFWKGVGIFAAFSCLEFYLIIKNCYNLDAMCFWFFLGKLIEIPLGIYLLMQMRTLQEGAKRIASGDLFHPIDTSRMFWELKKHGDYINNVGESIQAAVNEQMKSERFKTELITNVSHDIKTPLTSIINYVDLIKKEEIQDEKLCSYVEVLDRQSARLKKLIEDLMEASKASTGNLKVSLEACDMDVLLTQVIGEFEEKLQSAQLQVIVDKPEHPVFIMADGRHMWRVLDNLLGNACKYALSGTRVYISLKQEGAQVVITFKNISKAALNIPSEELMGRFVRGDSSRNTEGSGLGLSIAQSLTELMHGSMKLDIDGDLFKVSLQFAAINK